MVTAASRPLKKTCPSTHQGGDMVQESVEEVLRATLELDEGCRALYGRICRGLGGGCQ